MEILPVAASLEYMARRPTDNFQQAKTRTSLQQILNKNPETQVKERVLSAQSEFKTQFKTNKIAQICKGALKSSLDASQGTSGHKPPLKSSSIYLDLNKMKQFHSNNMSIAEQGSAHSSNLKGNS